MDYLISYLYGHFNIECVWMMAGLTGAPGLSQTDWTLGPTADRLHIEPIK